MKVTSPPETGPGCCVMTVTGGVTSGGTSGGAEPVSLDDYRNVVQRTFGAKMLPDDVYAANLLSALGARVRFETPEPLLNPHEIGPPLRVEVLDDLRNLQCQLALLSRLGQRLSLDEVAQVGARMHVLSMVKQVAGKDLSFNNVLDLNSGRLLVGEFEVPACAIIKHNNPCGTAIGSAGREARRANFLAGRRRFGHRAGLDAPRRAVPAPATGSPRRPRA